MNKLHATGTQSEHLWRAAICLNNAGVTLLARGSFKPAYQTFMDATSVFKLPFDCPVNDNVLSQTDDAVRRATLLLSQQDHLPCHFKVRTIVNDSSLQSAMALTQGPIPNQSDILPIHMDPTEIEDYEQDAHYLSAICLYNFGIAHLCFAANEDDKKSANGLRVAAIKLLTLANSILSNEVARCQGGSCNPLPTMQFSKIMVLAIVTAGAMGRAYLDMGYGVFSRVMRAHVGQLRGTLHSFLCETWCELGFKHAPAA